MNPLHISALVFAGISLAAILGQVFSLSEEHKADASRGVVTFTQTALVSLASLVLGLLVASANDHNRAQSEQVKVIAARVVTVHRMLMEYGPAARPAIEASRKIIENTRNNIWGLSGATGLLDTDGTMFRGISELKPETPEQTFLKGAALLQMVEILRSASAMATSNDGASSRTILLWIVVCWYVFLFFVTGLFAKLNVIGVSAALVGSGAVASAVLMILALDMPFAGIFMVSDQPLRAAIAIMQAR